MSQSPNTTSPMKSTESPNSSPLNATPITTIHPSFASALNPKPKKTTAKRPPISMTPKSKKKSKTSSSTASKKSTKAKPSKSKLIHTMQELYVNDVTKKNVESHVEASDNLASDLIIEKEKGNSEIGAETLEIQKGVNVEKSISSKTIAEGIVNDSPNAEESLNNNVVEEVLNSLKDTIPKPNVVSDVETSLAQEEPTADEVGDAVDDENLAPLNHENIVQQDDEEPADNNAADGNTTDIPTADNAMSVDDVVDVDAMADLDQTVNEVASGSIARRLRNRKGKDADVVDDML
ncbi:hypothetical protein P8452_21233 [Trifolium repens]|nr:hypothetical protein P8452_21233 [Trifolium repens]